MIIKEASQATGISVDNLRYYERIGLIPPVPRTESGIRDYDEISLQWVEFVMKFKRAGVPLESIIEYTRLAMEGDHTKNARRDILMETKENLLRKMEEIQEFLNLIDFKIDTYYSECLPATDKLAKTWKKHEDDQK